MDLHHPVTGNTITVADERVAAIHALSGWVPVPNDEPDAGPVRPSDDDPPRAWLAYAAEIGMQVDETQIESPEQLVALVDAHLGLQPGPMPDHAEQLIAWIGDDPARALEAREAEAQRPTPRKTVTEHIASVLDDPSQED